MYICIYVYIRNFGGYKYEIQFVGILLINVMKIVKMKI